MDTDFSILQETHVNFSHLHDIRELWDGEVIISPGKTQSCGVLVLAKRTASLIEQIITGSVRRFVFFKTKNATDAVLALYALSGTMREQHTDGKMFLRNTKKFFYKNIDRKNNLIILGEFNMALGNKDRSIGNKGFCKSQEELISVVTEFDLEDFWRRQTPQTAFIYALSWQE